MANLQQFDAKLCYIAIGVLIHQGKTLLVKHKKLDIWLAPGGHIDPDELPHTAAEREFKEETGVEVTVATPPPIESVDSEYLPQPFATNLHWISKENYQKRLDSPDQSQPQPSKKWPKGCEQHLSFLYLVKPVNPNHALSVKIDPQESTEFGWFGPEEIDSLETNADIKNELHHAFSLV